MGGAQQDEDLARLIKEWSRSKEGKLAPELRANLQDVALRGIAAFRRQDIPWGEINPDELAIELAERWGRTLGAKPQRQLREAFAEIVGELLANEPPKEVTLWIWDLNQDDRTSAQEIEQNLFETLAPDLRGKIGGILRSQRFVGVSYRVDLGDLMSELYLRLSNSRIPRLPRNRKQFLAMADVVIQNILKDRPREASWFGLSQKTHCIIAGTDQLNISNTGEARQTRP
jgi:hypothetical protein